PGAGAASGAVYSLALCSPAAMLGVERGNVDLLLFVLVLAGVLVVARGRPGLARAGLLVLLAGVLKLFPIFAAGFFVRRPARATAGLIAGLAAAFLVYVAATWHVIDAVLHAVPESTTFSYGVRRVSVWVSAFATSHVSGSLASY